MRQVVFLTVVLGLPCFSKTRRSPLNTKMISNFYSFQLECQSFRLPNNTNSLNIWIRMKQVSLTDARQWLPEWTPFLVYLAVFCNEKSQITLTNNVHTILVFGNQVVLYNTLLATHCLSAPLRSLPTVAPSIGFYRLYWEPVQAKNRFLVSIRYSKLRVYTNSTPMP